MTQPLKPKSEEKEGKDSEEEQKEGVKAEEDHKKEENPEERSKGLQYTFVASKITDKPDPARAEEYKQMSEYFQKMAEHYSKLASDSK